MAICLRTLSVLPISTAKVREGLELSREDSLRGEDGAKVVLRDNKGNIVDSLDSPRNSVPKNGQT